MTSGGIMAQQAKHEKDDERERPYSRETPNRRDGDPLDGSTSGTIGGGGATTGGRTTRPAPQDERPVKPEDAASGRLAPDDLAATVERDELSPGPSDVSNATRKSD